MRRDVDPIHQDLLHHRLLQIADDFGAVSDPLGAAMRHAALSSGKRFRGMLLLLAADASGGVCDTMVDAAAAIEMVHAASLIFDDMPCMDNASLRRGQPATHVTHGESRALLAGIALITEAMAVLATARGTDGRTRAQLVRILTQALGPRGLCAGQDLDLHADKSDAGIEREQDLKTGVLFVAGLEMLAVVKEFDAEDKAQMIAFGRQLGRVFQSYDDLLDVIGDRETLGKDPGRDAAAPGPKRGLLAVADLQQVSRHYQASRAQLDAMLRSKRLQAPEIAALLERVLPYGVSA
ncbi:polyprenyl synthetase family protein [Paracoccus nototheniae]|uniref:Polyprenyl synthetase family protein n=1 Tax=Paracoccus nototheniae TaxID=2489002 RepID=A0ABW4DXR2_9RHOB|nr:polyprenyl synthetase family protein [Paracoccus nototheniae]